MTPLDSGPVVDASPATTVLIADDHQLLRQALRRALEDAGFAVVGEAANGEDAVEQAASLRPDVAVIDVTMPVLDGIEATRRMHAVMPEMPVVVLTMHDDGRIRAEAVGAGATAFLTKDCSMQEVVATIDATSRGEVLLSAGLASSMILAIDSDEEPSASSPLTPREAETLQLVADGLSTSEVAARLFISAKTVKNHLASIYSKLDARDRTQAVLAAVKSGIIRLR